MSVSNNTDFPSSNAVKAPKSASTSLSSQITAATLIIALFLVIFLPPLYSNQIANLKNLIIFITAILLTFYFCLVSFRRRQFQLTKSPLTFPLLALATVTILATLINYPFSPQENFLNYAGLFLSLAVIAILGSSLIKVKNSKLVITSITAAAAIIGLLTFLKAFAILFPQTAPQLAFTNFQIGTPLITFAFLFVAAIGCVTLYIKKGKLVKPYNFFLPIIILGLLSVFVIAFQEYSTNTPLFMSPKLSWQTTLNALELNSPGLEIMTASDPLVDAPDPSSSPLLSPSLGQKIKMWLIGTGSESYGDVYNLYKPQWVLQTPLNNFNFTKGFNLPLTTIPTLGLLFTLLWFWLFIKVCLEFKNQNGGASHLFLMPATAFALQLFVPAEPILIFTQAILIAFGASYSTQKTLKLNTSRLSGQISYFIILILCFGLSIWFSIFLGKSYSAFAADRTSLEWRKELTSQPQASTIYLKKANQATSLQPHLDLLQRHAALARLQSIIPTPTDPSTLETQYLPAIQAAQDASQLRPHRALNWSTLGYLYQEAQNPTLSITAYGRAILLDPFNINNYLQLGQIFTDLHQYSEALLFFQKALEINPESPEAHYQLGNIYRQLDQKEAAYLEFQKSLSNLDPEDLAYFENLKFLQSEMNSLGLNITQIPGTPTSLAPLLTN